MLQKLFGSRGHAEAVAVDKDETEVLNAMLDLDASYAALEKTEDGYVDTASESGYRACTEFLEQVALTAEAFHLEANTRDFRDSYSINYQMLFPDKARNYRVDLLGASAGQCAVIWVNGDKFEFSPDAVVLATALQEAWSQLCQHLDDKQEWKDSPSSNLRGIMELKPLLRNLDLAWANFEHRYILELMEIEDKARGLIVEAVEKEQRLQSLEERFGEDDVEAKREYIEARIELVSAIGRLNAVANFNRKGREDFGAEVLESAIATLKLCGGDADCHMTTEELEVAQSLASDVVESYQAMRDYLSEVSSVLTRVDPHLRNNPGLVNRLVDLEETWEIGTRYVGDAAVLRDVCGLVTEVRASARVVPSLSSMCETCDVELFLCLPRLVWLRFLDAQAELPLISDGLVQTLLPHRFITGRPPSQEVGSLLAKFELARQSIACGRPKSFARLMLTQLACSCVASPRLPPGQERETAIEAADGFIHDLEAWSMELQRNCPEDWNQCAAVLVQLLSEGSTAKDRRCQFRV